MLLRIRARLGVIKVRYEYKLAFYRDPSLIQHTVTCKGNDLVIQHG